jgi:hypothetical protein
MNLPLEIVRLVIGEATRVPAAFDTSFKVSISEHVETVADSIRESMKTKLALCLVSKSFHDMTIEFLYEIITLRQLQYANPLVNLLRRKTKSCKQYCGWWCHRLEITIGEGSNEYYGEMWPRDVHTLWTLVYSCPRLVIFLCTVHFNMINRLRHSLIPPGSKIPNPSYPVSVDCIQLFSDSETDRDTWRYSHQAGQS